MTTEDGHPEVTHRVTARRTGVWASPDPTAAPQGRYRRGDELTVVHEAGHGWVQVVDRDGYGGWLDSAALVPLEGGRADRSRRRWPAVVAVVALLLAGGGAFALAGSGDDADGEQLAEPVATTVAAGPVVPLVDGLELVAPGDWAVDDTGDVVVVATSGIDLSDTTPSGTRIEVGPVTDPDPEPADTVELAEQAVEGELEAPELEVLDPSFAGVDAVVYDLTVAAGAESQTTRTVIFANGDDEPVLLAITAPTDDFDAAVDEAEGLVEAT